MAASFIHVIAQSRIDAREISLPLGNFLTVFSIVMSGYKN